MNHLPLALSIVLGCLMIPDYAESRGLRVPRLGTGSRALAVSPTVPAGWAGIWQNRDSTYVGCLDPQLDETSTDLDTLCVGESLGLMGDGLNYACEGTFDDGAFDLTCTGASQMEDCTAHFDLHMTGTRTGDTAVTVSTLRIRFGPAEACFNQPDQCTRIVTHATRLGAPPAECATPVRTTTWSGVKALYR